MTVSRLVAVLTASLALISAVDARATGQAAAALLAFDARSTKQSTELELLWKRVGSWNVTMTMRPSATAAPVIVAGLVAERAMVGPYLQEIMRPASGTTAPDFRRIDYLTFNTLQARWQYLSMDTRATVGLMFAQGFGRAQEKDVTVYFNDFPAPTELGPEIAGRYARARHVLTRETDDHEFVRQYWSVDGGPEWVGIQYEYTRAGKAPSAN
jgi:hypothetical protein